jgi:phenylacetate-CoA ligase
MAAQLERLRAMIAAIVPGNRFYAPRLAAAGVTPAIGSLAEFSARMPFTTKAELVADQAAHPPYGSNLTYEVERYSRYCQTSGTSGRPLVILDDAESWEWMLGNWAHIFRAAGVQRGDRVYFAFSFGPFLGFWTAFEAAARQGLLSIPGGGLGTAARLRVIIEQRATVVCCTPTYALHLAEVARSEGIDLGAATVRTILVAGEPGGNLPTVRERISGDWNGAHVVDHYGMTEVGPVTFQAVGEDVARVIEGSYFPEIVNSQTGDPTPDGEIGELVLTTLGRLGAPLLRYRTGDLVRRAERDAGFALAGGIVGRADDMVVVRGVNLYPAAVDAVVRRLPDIGEYQVELTRRGALVEVGVRIECQQPDTKRVLEGALAEAFSLRIPVETVAHGSLPRFELKARRWLRRDREE